MKVERRLGLPSCRRWTGLEPMGLDSTDLQAMLEQEPGPVKAVERLVVECQKLGSMDMFAQRPADWLEVAEEEV